MRIKAVLATFALFLWSAAAAAASAKYNNNLEQLNLKLTAPLSVDCAAPSTSVEDALAALERSLTVQLRRQSYYSPRYSHSLNTDSVSGNPSDGCWHIDHQIEPGPRALVRTVVLSIEGQGANQSSFAQEKDQFPVQVGNPMNEAAYEAFKENLLRIALEEGYLRAQYPVHRIEVHSTPESSEAFVDIQLIFDTGAAYRLGETRIAAPEVPLTSEFISSLLPYHRGEPFSASVLQEFRERLAAANYFSEYDVRPDLTNAESDEVPILVTLRSLPRHDLTVGAGFATDIGPRGLLAYENRFLTNNGQQAAARARISPVLSDLTASWRLASNRPAEDWYSLEVGYKHEDTEDVRSNNITLGVRRVSVLGSGWRRTLGLDAAHESFDVGDDDGRTLLLVPSLNWQRSKTTGSPLQTGYSLEGTLQGAHETLLSDVSFIQLYARASLGLSAGERARWLFRGELGASWVAGFSELPPTYRFFAGGDESVRGYDFKSLGPKADNGDVKGGRSLVSAGVEYEYLVWDQWSLAVFFDAGDAFDDFDDDLRYGAGFGVRWHTPVGAVRLDLAHPFHDSRSVRVHIGFGRLQ